MSSTTNNHPFHLTTSNLRLTQGPRAREVKIRIQWRVVRSQGRHPRPQIDTAPPERCGQVGTGGPPAREVQRKPKLPMQTTSASGSAVIVRRRRPSMAQAAHAKVWREPGPHEAKCVQVLSVETYMRDTTRSSHSPTVRLARGLLTLALTAKSKQHTDARGTPREPKSTARAEQATGQRSKQKTSGQPSVCTRAQGEQTDYSSRKRTGRHVVPRRPA